MVNQFRVDVPGGRTFIVPNVVLFGNDISVVVVECEGPSTLPTRWGRESTSSSGVPTNAPMWMKSVLRAPFLTTISSWSAPFGGRHGSQRLELVMITTWNGKVQAPFPWLKSR